MRIIQGISPSIVVDWTMTNYPTLHYEFLQQKFVKQSPHANSKRN